jgi:hypothetical protein
MMREVRIRVGGVSIDARMPASKNPARVRPNDEVATTITPHA